MEGGLQCARDRRRLPDGVFVDPWDEACDPFAGMSSEELSGRINELTRRRFEEMPDEELDEWIEKMAAIKEKKRDSRIPSGP